MVEHVIEYEFVDEVSYESYVGEVGSCGEFWVSMMVYSPEVIKMG